ncbi:MAG TPA: AMP-binding protein, partial [Rhodanobacter sp.]|nr:AMP-binding protein [Rhodanobacter sp.]
MHPESCPSCRPAASAAALPLLAADDLQRTVAWRAGHAVSAGTFLAHVAQVAAALPPATAAVNLCEDRYAFLVAFCALVVRGQVNLLPPSRAPQMVAEVMATHPGCYALGEQARATALRGYHRLPPLADEPFAGAVPMVPADQLALIAYTSGSTGTPRPNAKRWGALHAATRGTRAMLARVAGNRVNVVATVPPQHIYGIETSVLLPLLGTIAVHAGKPFFPADIAAALATVPAPRVLVTTPVHLRALVAANLALPPLAAMLSATAPMPPELAGDAERAFGAPLVEVFGSTETCAIASRRLTADTDWALYPGVALHPRPDGTEVSAPQLDAPVVLADLMEVDAAAHR